ncbi:hypothetical protein [Streptomyces sp. NEAU-S77]
MATRHVVIIGAGIVGARFGGQPEDELRRRALSLYRDIYATA